MYLSSTFHVGRTGCCHKKPPTLRRAETRRYHWVHKGLYTSMDTSWVQSYRKLTALRVRDITPLPTYPSTNPNVILPTGVGNTTRTMMDMVQHGPSPPSQEPRPSKESEDTLHDQKLHLNVKAKGKKSLDTNSDSQSMNMEFLSTLHLREY